MSFLTDPPALYASGRAYAQTMPESAQGARAGVAGALTVGAFLIGSIALYLNIPVARSIARRLGTRDGRDLMLNSWVFDFDTKRVSTRTHVLAAVMFALYPLWWWLGWDQGRRARPR